MTADRTGGAVPRLTDEQASRLEAILTELVSVHETLLDRTGAYRAAVSSADAQAMTERMTSLAESLQRAAELDEERRELVGVPRVTLTRRPGPTVAEVAALLDEPRRGRLMELAATLRPIVEGVRDEQRTLAEATRTLSTHMRGILRQVSARLSHAGTYGSRGCVESGAQVVSGLDVRR